jgi:hypothetical protein
MHAEYGNGGVVRVVLTNCAPRGAVLLAAESAAHEVGTLN